MRSREKRHANNTLARQFSTAAYLFERHLIYTKRLINLSGLGNTLGHSERVTIKMDDKSVAKFSQLRTASALF